MNSITAVIITYMREQVLIDSIECLLSQTIKPSEILIVDQTPQHEPAVHERLIGWHQSKVINWIRLKQPSIPRAMNKGPNEAIHPIVLYLDDDIVANENLVNAHLKAYETYPEASAVVGQVLQPGESSQQVEVTCPRSGLTADLGYPFYSNRGDWVKNVIACNLSVRKDEAIAVGGFDENFAGVAYRFETEFARRLLSAGRRVLFYPDASICHLRAPSGGTRSEGSHMTSVSPRHGAGDYYFAFLHGKGLQRWSYSLARVFREVRTKFHLTHPWWIPVKLLGEVRALIAGHSLAAAKRRQAEDNKRSGVSST